MRHLIATSNSDEAKLRMALGIFAHFGCRLGEPLLRHDFFAVAAQRDWRMADIGRGIAVGDELEYFKRGDNNSVCLTERGFAAM
ncbi:hypothetical protein D9599_25900 [Roseomonas sp. KE2513]|uniref:hypothetical protein n=1 Tax=Roseomonas sp. KE2513 TaxID=2479202 RepID=UPI0018E01939|nr:hypothetical protein [Roseomonas sp. KE2513]MBI0538990.1 hypothetical protein [Roseomonas sp. KE2513]